MTRRKPVLVQLHVEAFGGEADETVEIGRDDWDGMTPAERSALLLEMTETHLANHASAGWHIEDPGDYAQTAG